MSVMRSSSGAFGEDALRFSSRTASASCAVISPSGTPSWWRNRASNTGSVMTTGWSRSKSAAIGATDTCVYRPSQKLNTANATAATTATTALSAFPSVPALYRFSARSATRAFG